PAIQAAIEECGFHCAGEALPKHVCQTHASSANAVAAPVDPGKSAAMKMPTGHEGMATGDMKMTAPKPGHKDHGGGKTDDMAHEMGHTAGGDLQSMVQDMRNR